MGGSPEDRGLEIEELKARNFTVAGSLIHNARRWPDEVFVTFADHTTWTRREALDIAEAGAGLLHASGVQPGDRVAIMLDNGEAFLRVWWAAAALGAVVVPINTAFLGDMLEHVLAQSSPRLFVGEETAMARTSELVSQHPDMVRLRPTDFTTYTGPARPTVTDAENWQTSAYLLTSGTTGLSKLARTSHLHAYLGGDWFIGARGRGRDDVFLADLPLFHASSFWQVSACLVTGTRFVVLPTPRARTYWATAREYGVTMGIVLASMISVIEDQPPSASDRDHDVRTLVLVPVPQHVKQFQDRFGIAEVWTGWGMTEVPDPLFRHFDDDLVAGYVGRQRDAFECRLVDSHDQEVRDGAVGELVVRSDLPWTLTSEYVGDPEATAASWRNGWFHTGDLMRKNGAAFHYVDRSKDIIRRRGENIPSAQVERIIATHPAVHGAACVAERDARGDEDVKAWIVADSDLDCSELLLYCAERLPYFMVPRYLEVIETFPLTPTGRVRKNLLRERGNSVATWDREEHGIRVTRHGVEAPDT